MDFFRYIEKFRVQYITTVNVGGMVIQYANKVNTERIYLLLMENFVKISFRALYVYTNKCSVDITQQQHKNHNNSTHPQLMLQFTKL